MLNSSADNSMQETPVATPPPPPPGSTNGVEADHVESRELSRASSTERDTEDETAATAAAAATTTTSAAVTQAGSKRSSRRNGSHVFNKRLKVSISKLHNEDESGGGDQAGKESSKPEIESESSNDASIFDLNAVITRPIKTTLDAQALLQNGPDDLR